MTEVYEPDFYPVDSGDSSQTERCTDCALRGPCVGLFNKYREAFGDEELRPVPGTRSNSYNYVLERTLPWPEGVPCPIVDSILPYDRGRHIFVRSNGEMLQYRTKTRDFSDPELWHIKFDHGQVYLDVSDKPAPDDFSRDLRKLRELPTCAACVHHGACARAYEIVEEDLFGRDDEAVRAIVADLRGDVLDVGCGETRYADVLGEPADRGALRYVGVEPSAEHAERARKSRPWARVENTAIERFPLEDQSYDHVLVLRSYNHFRDPGAVLTWLARALRPGGSIVIVDNVAFGLVRTAEQTNRAESSTSEFEHYNNHDSFEAQQHVPADLLALEDHQPVTAAGSNQWVLRYTRRA